MPKSKTLFRVSCVWRLDLSCLSLSASLSSTEHTLSHLWFISSYFTEIWQERVSYVHISDTQQLWLRLRFWAELACNFVTTYHAKHQQHTRTHARTNTLHIQPLYNVSRQSSPPISGTVSPKPCTSHLSTVAHRFPALLSWLNYYLTLRV